MTRYERALKDVCIGCMGACDGQMENCSTCGPLKELVEKATPKKLVPITLKEDVKLGRNVFKKGTSILRKCPTCERWVSYTIHDNFCGNCGQALNWNEEEVKSNGN